MSSHNTQSSNSADYAHRVVLANNIMENVAAVDQLAVVKDERTQARIEEFQQKWKAKAGAEEQKKGTTSEKEEAKAEKSDNTVKEDTDGLGAEMTSEYAGKDK